MKKVLKRKIVLARETLLALTQPEIQGVAGGAVSGHPTCSPAYTCPECAYT